MKVFIDTNILLDWMLQNRPCKEECEAILSAAKNNSFKLVVTTQSIIDANFSARKNGVNHKSFEESVNHLRSFAEITAIDWIDLSWALSHYSGDFEDDMQYASAYNSVCDYFITRDKKLTELNDILNPMTVISPEDFVAQMMAD
jgi:predicted nucleic acid-binding protein